MYYISFKKYYFPKHQVTHQFFISGAQSIQPTSKGASVFNRGRFDAYIFFLEKNNWTLVITILRFKTNNHSLR